MTKDTVLTFNLKCILSSPWQDGPASAKGLGALLTLGTFLLYVARPLSYWSSAPLPQYPSQERAVLPHPDDKQPSHLYSVLAWDLSPVAHTSKPKFLYYQKDSNPLWRPTKGSLSRYWGHHTELLLSLYCLVQLQLHKVNHDSRSLAGKIQRQIVCKL